MFETFGALGATLKPFLLIVGKKRLPKGYPKDKLHRVVTFSSSFSRTLRPFTLARPTSARQYVFRVFKQKKRTYPHMCLLRWKDQQVCRDRLYRFNKIKRRGKMKTSKAPRINFGALFAQVGSVSTPRDYFECISASNLGSILPPYRNRIGIG